MTIFVLSACNHKTTDTKFQNIKTEFDKIANELSINSPTTLDDTALKALFDINPKAIHNYYGIMSLDEYNNDIILYIYTDKDKTTNIMNKMREYSEIFSIDGKYHIFRVHDRCFLIQSRFADFEKLEEFLTEISK